jgi:hypothetical protein
VGAESPFLDEIDRIMISDARLYFPSAEIISSCRQGAGGSRGPSVCSDEAGFYSPNGISDADPIGGWKDGGPTTSCRGNNTLIGRKVLFPWETGNGDS